MKISSNDIKASLSARHYQDFFQAEVKDGPTWGTSHLRLDALAVKKSWSKPCFTGYEIKVSRSDFNADDKWHSYLPYCHRFYFVCPKGLLAKDEISSPAGLMVYNPENKQVRIVKSAKHRHVEPDPDLFMYLLMNSVQSDRYPFSPSKHEFYKKLVEEKRIDKELTPSLSSYHRMKIAELTAKERGLQHKRDALKEELDLIKSIKDFLREKKLLGYWGYQEKLISSLEKVFEKNHKDPMLDNELRELSSRLEKLNSFIKERA